jgi:hypothetical protein
MSGTSVVASSDGRSLVAFSRIAKLSSKAVGLTPLGLIHPSYRPSLLLGLRMFERATEMQMCPQCHHKIGTRARRCQFCPRCGCPLPRAARRPKRVLIILFLFAALGLLATSGFTLVGGKARHVHGDGSPLAHADALWQKGLRAEGAEAYKAGINDRLLDLSQSERTRAFERLIGWQIERGGPEAAAAYLDKAILFNVPLSLDTMEGNRAVAEARRRAMSNGNPWTDPKAGSDFVRDGSR